VKEELGLNANEDYKFTYDAKHDEIIFAIYNPTSKSLYLEFHDGTTLQDTIEPRKTTLLLSGIGDQQTGNVMGILPIDSTHYILHLYQ